MIPDLKLLRELSGSEKLSMADHEEEQMDGKLKAATVKTGRDVLVQEIVIVSKW